MKKKNHILTDYLYPWLKNTTQGLTPFPECDIAKVFIVSHISALMQSLPNILITLSQP